MKVVEFFGRWGFTIALCVVVVAVLFSLGCSIYTAIINAVVGGIGIVGNIASLGLFAWLIYKAIKNNRV